MRLTCLDCHKCRLCKRRKKSWQEYELHCPLVMSERRSTTEGWIRKTKQKGRFGRSLKIRSNHFADFLWIREEAILQIILLFLSQHQILSFFPVHYSWECALSPGDSSITHRLSKPFIHSLSVHLLNTHYAKGISQALPVYAVFY